MTTYIYLANFDQESAKKLVDKLQNSTECDIRVTTSNEFDSIEGYDERAGARVDSIFESDLFVYLARQGIVPKTTILRDIELGIAIGAEVPVAFIGSPRNAYQRFGDIFETPEEFVAAWYSRTTS